MYKKNFAKYIRAHSTPFSINNAFYVYPRFMEQRGTLFIYEYLGGSKRPYVIEIKLDEKNDIHQTACSCPYDYKGICKHIVASVEDLADRLDKGSLATQTVFFDVAKQVKKLETSDVKLIDGEFDLENLRKRIQKKSITYGYVNYIDLNFA